MSRPSRLLTTAAGLAVALAVASPALASAQGSSHGGFGVANRAGVAIHHAASSAASPSLPSTGAFPSASSTVVASVGFLDAEKIGYFWSASRGDSVAESFSGPGKVKKAILKLDVTENFLAAGATTDWTLSINGKDVGSFQVTTGVTGPVTNTFKFAKITGGTYDVKMRMTNEVAGGQGSISLRYAGTGQHSITLKKH